MSDTRHAHSGIEPWTEASALLEDWHALLATSREGYAKGMLLERFAVELFGHAFDVVEHNFRAGNGQVDLVLENNKTNPFWMDFGADIAVECKHTTAKTAASEVNKFIGAISPMRTRLGFYVSTAGFTAALETGTGVEQFLKSAIRAVTLRRKTGF